ncbi:MAG: DNA-processing protein DprA, partial [Thermoguttaceae bacterium]|nr:DNA-processing protein DprA [Thermoguttaceae bacterium]
MSGEGYSGRLWNDDGSEDGRGAEYGADSDAPRREYSPDELADEITLASVDGVGPLTAFRLVEYFGSAGAVLDAHESDLARVEKVGPVLARKIALARSTFDVESLVKFCVANDVAILSLNDTRYPARLLDIATPPRILYVRGELRPEDYHAIAMVGTRTPTPYGRAQATRLAHELVDAGFTVVSGLALGIDGASHRGALDAKGRTIAVLGGGVVRIYPQEHEDLAGRVMNSGALVSEYGPLTSPMRGNFPARNRIISGLAIGVLVVESGEKGGSLITAR